MLRLMLPLCVTIVLVLAVAVIRQFNTSIPLPMNMFATTGAEMRFSRWNYTPPNKAMQSEN